ncbi:ASCH domain-containing protein [Agrilactobacillus fermenti]|uniref:ASCH domain-containing protein n=1 Tax=Agrilactobacillus fermenti TaxID=2586909 RepID=UPI001E422C33|nr:ASCH domain-containing protein [Agrilactobacillus fermenti]MCD2257499.1 ASCH domain-containing protein [Agrilactobacillus fermenti]
MKILLSIRPEFVDEIRSGRKLFEYRKGIFRKRVDKVVVYSTEPCGRVVGEFEVKAVLQDAPDKLWNKTSKFSGISHDFFEEYFDGRETAYAIEIENYQEYEIPRKIQELFPNVKAAPQSFIYV